MDVSKADHSSVTFSDCEPGNANFTISNGTSVLTPANLTEIQRALALQREIIARKSVGLTENRFAESKRKELTEREEENILATPFPLLNVAVPENVSSLSLTSSLMAKPSEFMMRAQAFHERRTSSDREDLILHSADKASAPASGGDNLLSGIEKNAVASFLPSGLKPEGPENMGTKNAHVETGSSLNLNELRTSARSGQPSLTRVSASLFSGERVQNGLSNDVGYPVNTYAMVQPVPAAKIAHIASIQEAPPALKGEPDSRAAHEAEKPVHNDAIPAVSVASEIVNATSIDKGSQVPERPQQFHGSSEQPVDFSRTPIGDTQTAPTLNYKFSTWKNTPTVSIELNKNEGVIAITDNLDVRSALTENYYLLSNAEPLHFSSEERGEKQQQHAQDQDDSDEENA